ncbi:MAG TPA: GNAT family N-acetyltransferase [Dehalococcoidales bacterium]
MNNRIIMCSIMELKEHSYTLRGEKVVLRPMTEDDWQVLARWETDPEVIYWADSDPKETRTLEEVQYIFRTVSQNAYCFVVEVEGTPIGSCWLQRMNMEEILEKYSGQDCWRIDLAFEKDSWGRGYGTDTIRTLTQFAFEHEKADIVFGGVSDYNEHSQRTFIRAGYKLILKLEDPPGSKAQYTYWYAISREDWKKKPAEF